MGELGSQWNLFHFYLNIKWTILEHFSHILTPLFFFKELILAYLITKKLYLLMSNIKQFISKFVVYSLAFKCHVFIGSHMKSYYCNSFFPKLFVENKSLEFFRLNILINDSVHFLDSNTYWWLQSSLISERNKMVLVPISCIIP